MLVRSFSALAALMLTAAHAAAEPMPSKSNPQFTKMSTRQMFGVLRRADDPYLPTPFSCGTGNTCAEACGAGFETCTATDSQVHCFDPTAGETCCPDSTGNSCEAGFFCAATTTKSTVCCNNGKSLEDCAKDNKVVGVLVSETAAPTTSSTTAPISSSTPVTTTAASSTVDKNTTTAATTTIYSTTSSAALIPVSFPTSNITSIISSLPSQLPTKSAVPTGGAENLATPGGLLLLAAGIAALL
ncbi:hypothetical protein B0T26DRAFT_660253 [Lasiosphaeria miniovina]|uniref:Prp 4 CRoW domain-containing protein n=1 Tax=Lasiosphaeria miniovina TaxID=1954250 RepID=A0AA40DJ42_9PEZI|nr:uncharacterized protein B0T26DRAFT_660253 [Lasiosphaeria miniovina]KAK0701808.1 hypothetical protein B0T26DRAFT_660253 [Lasiosphaeria miniovina]